MCADIYRFWVIFMAINYMFNDSFSHAGGMQPTEACSKHTCIGISTN